jgi:hypothetical protein
MRSAHFGALRNLGAFLAVMASHAANALRLRNVRNWLSGMQPNEQLHELSGRDNYGYGSCSSAQARHSSAVCRWRGT